MKQETPPDNWEYLESSEAVTTKVRYCFTNLIFAEFMFNDNIFENCPDRLLAFLDEAKKV